MKIAFHAMIIVLKVGCTAYLISKVVVSRLRQVWQTLERSFGMERREGRMIRENLRQEGQTRFAEKMKTALLPQPLMARARQQLNANRNSRLDDQVKKLPLGARRLYLAIVNRAILDVLENGENSRAAAQWLLSRDFDSLQELFG